MKSLRKIHKWLGLVLAIFLILFALSGIALNHRKAFSTIGISRSLLPNSYQYSNWNNGLIKGSFVFDNAILMYGGSGIWLTDSTLSTFEPFNKGLKNGADNRKISNIIKMPNGTVFTAGLYDLYARDNDEWRKIEITNFDDRITDITNKGDSLIVLSRSDIYLSLPPYLTYTKIQIQKPINYEKEVSLFKTIWNIHSGEIFGLAGKLVVDIVGGVFIVLAVTGILYTFLPKIIRRKKKRAKRIRTDIKLLNKSVKWHNKLGALFIVLMIIITITGSFLRPPLMIAVITKNISPIPFSTMDSENPWQDKLRAIRYDSTINKWIVSTSSGFFKLDSLDSTPKYIKKAPPISPMGINVFEELEKGKWLIASFSGAFIWDVEQDITYDYYTNKRVEKSKQARPVASCAVSGFSNKTVYGRVMFEYSKGATSSLTYPEMPKILEHLPMSLWNFALEVHVGRMYRGFIANNSFIFIFLSGVLSSILLVSGYYIYMKRSNKR